MKYVGIVLGALIIIASFLPWASVTILEQTETMTGFATNAGKITLVCGALFIVFFMMAEKKMLWKILGAIMALLSALIVFLNYNDVKSVGDLGGMVTIGFGLWLTLIASVAAMVVIFLVKKPMESTPKA